MRIDTPLSLPENMQTANVMRSGSSPQQSPAAPITSSQDKTQLTVDSGAVNQLKATLSQLPEIRRERVNALRQAVNNGSYQVSNQQLADAIGTDLLGRIIG